MCGIVGYVGMNDTTGVLIEGLKKLEYRGYDSAGISVIQDGKIATVKSKGRLDNLEKKINEVGTPIGICGIGHTRWATHGEPSDINSHPHGDSRISIVHNGIIENYLQIKSYLIEKGYEFLSETDTECVAKLLDYYYDGDPVETIIKVISKIKGSYALGIVFKDFPDRIFATRKDAPLIAGIGNNENFIASDIPAILQYTKDYYLLEEGEIAVITKENIEVLDVYRHTVEKEKHTFIWDMSSAEKDGYPHFMLKEINEQARALTDTISPRISEDLIPDFDIKELSDADLQGINRIHIVACGTAMHAGMVGKAAIEKLARVPVEVEIASEFRYKNPILSPNDLVIIISQSGETADTLAALRLAKDRGVKTLAIVNVVGSSIAREADSVIYTWAGLEIAVASTKAYSVQLSVMYMFAIRLAYANGAITFSKAQELTSQLQEIPDEIKAMLNSSDDCKYYASLFINCKDLFFLGRGIDYSLSLEGSLKLKEISYIHSEAYAAGELKHGTISLIVDDMPVIALATQEDLSEKMISNIKEVKARGAKVLVVSQLDTELFSDSADFIITLPKVNDIFMPLIATIPLQLFAYYSSVLRGCDVDKPRNLAKSVTVE